MSGKFRSHEVRRVGRRLASKGLKVARSWVRFKDSPRIFFVVGGSRSGTTWLMRMLNAHPEILCRGEGRFFGQEWRLPFLIDMPERKQPSSLYNALATSEYLRAWIERSVWSRDEDAERHMENLTRLAINYFLTQKLTGTNKSIVGDKTPLATLGIAREISVLCPEAKVVHIIRDGRDRAVSLMHYLWNTAQSEGGIYPVEDDELAKRDAYRKDPQQFLEAGESIFTEERLRRISGDWSAKVDETIRAGAELLGENYAEVRYEDLLADSEGEARRLISFLGGLVTEDVLERCVGATSFEKRSKGRKKGEEDSTSTAARKGVAGDWRNVFTERDRAIFKEEAGKTLIKAGYERNLDW